MDSLISYVQSHKQLTEIPSSLFSQSSLQRLDLRYNRLSHTSGLDKFPLLQEIQLGSNELVRLDGISKLKELESLWLQNNLITSDALAMSGVNKLQNIKTLVLMRNKITNVMTSFEQISIFPVALTKLNIAGNSITSLQGIGMLVLLQELDASENEITCLDYLAKCSSLTELKLSHNRISSCKPMQLPNLMILDLSSNLLTSLTLPKCDSLAEIYVSNNKISNVDGLAHFPHLEILDVSNNSLDAEVSTLTGILRRFNLVELKIANNPCSGEITDDFVRKMADSVVSLEVVDGFKVSRDKSKFDMQLSEFDSDLMDSSNIVSNIENESVVCDNNSADVRANSVLDQKFSSNPKPIVSNYNTNILQSRAKPLPIVPIEHVVSHVPQSLFDFPTEYKSIQSKSFNHSKSGIKPNDSVVKTSESLSSLLAIRSDSVEISNLAQNSELQSRPSSGPILIETIEINPISVNLSRKDTLNQMTTSKTASLLTEMDKRLTLGSVAVKSLCKKAKLNFEKSAVVDNKISFAALPEDSKETIRTVVSSLRKAPKSANRLADSLSLLRQTTLEKKNRLESNENEDIVHMNDFDDNDDEEIENWLKIRSEKRMLKNSESLKMSNSNDISSKKVDDFLHSEVNELPKTVVSDPSDVQFIEDSLAEIQNRVKERLSKNISLISDQILFSEQSDNVRRTSAYSIKPTSELKRNSVKVKSRSTSEGIIPKTDKPFVADFNPVLENFRKFENKPSADISLNAQAQNSFVFSNKPNPISQNSQQSGHGVNKYLETTAKLRARFNAIISSVPVEDTNLLKSDEKPDNIGCEHLHAELNDFMKDSLVDTVPKPDVVTPDVLAEKSLEEKPIHQPQRTKTSLRDTGKPTILKISRPYKANETNNAPIVVATNTTAPKGNVQMFTTSMLFKKK